MFSWCTDASESRGDAAASGGRNHLRGTRSETVCLITKEKKCKQHKVHWPELWKRHLIKVFSYMILMSCVWTCMFKILRGGNDTFRFALDHFVSPHLILHHLIWVAHNETMWNSFFLQLSIFLIAERFCLSLNVLNNQLPACRLRSSPQAHAQFFSPSLTCRLSKVPLHAPHVSSPASCSKIYIDCSKEGLAKHIFP